MACAACLGLGDRKIVGQMPSAFSAAHTLLVGVRDWECDEIKERQQQLGIANLTTEQLREQPELLGRKLQEMGCSHAVVHFDLMGACAYPIRKSGDKQAKTVSCTI